MDCALEAHVTFRFGVLHPARLRRDASRLHAEEIEVTTGHVFLPHRQSEVRRVRKRQVISKTIAIRRHVMSPASSVRTKGALSLSLHDTTFRVSGCHLWVSTSSAGNIVPRSLDPVGDGSLWTA